MNARSNRGFTLVELAIVVALLGIVVGALAAVGMSSDRTYRTGATAAHLEAQAAMTVERLVVELQSAGNETVTPDPVEHVGSPSISYERATGLSAGEVVWSTTRRLAFEYETGELDNGLDDNQNGLADEGRVVLREDFGGPNERARVLTRWVREYAAGETPNGADDDGNGLVDERGFHVERSGEALVVRLTLEKLDGVGRLSTRTARTSARLRN